MNETTTQPRTDSAPRRLYRSRDDKMIAGVAGGLGRHLGMDPVIVRLAFVALAALGGSGILLYLLAWIIVPKEPSDRERTEYVDAAATIDGTAPTDGPGPADPTDGAVPADPPALPQPPPCPV